MGKSYLNTGDLNGRPAKMRPARTAEELREIVRLAREEAATDGLPAPAQACAAPPLREEKADPKPQSALPVLSHEQRVAQRAVFRHACDWLDLHHLCANARCRKAKSCRGEPMACLRVGVAQAPESARTFVRLMIEGKELGLSFEEAMDDAEEFQDGWAAWIAGLKAAQAAKPAKKSA
jgi:hypothetical protein